MDLKEINEALNLYIRPSSFPVACKLLRSDDELPVKGDALNQKTKKITGSADNCYPAKWPPPSPPRTQPLEH
jgi:hypothetical protein